MSALASSPDLKLVKDKRNPELLRIIKEGKYTLSGLKQQYGISDYYLKKDYGARGRRGRPKASQARQVAETVPREPEPAKNKPKEPAKPPKVEEEPRPQTEFGNRQTEFGLTSPKEPRPITAQLFGAFFILLALLAAGDGAVMAVLYGYSVTGIPGGVIGFVIDGGALLFLPGARLLWRQRTIWWLPPPLCVIAILAWLLFVGGSSYAALNYTGVNVGDYFQNRGDTETTRSDLNKQLKREEAKRAKIQEDGDTKVLENRMNLALGMVPQKNKLSSEDCTKPTLSKDLCADYTRLKDAWTAADARDRLDVTIVDLNKQLRALPHVSEKHTAAAEVAQMSGGRIDQEQAVSYSIRWWAIVPGFASIMMTIGLALCSKRKPK